MDVGSTLKKARLAKKLSMADVEEATKIRTKYLEAMEENNFSTLPPGMYGSAFLRTYARFLDLNADELVSAYRETTGLSQPVIEEDSPDEVRPARTGGRTWTYVAALVILAAIVGAFNLHSLFNPAPKAVPPTAPGSTAQNQGQPVQPAGDQVAASGLNLVLKATNSYSWYSVSVDGGIASQGFIYAGQEKDFQGSQNINIVLGSAGSVNVSLNGQDLGYLGGQGIVVSHTFSSQGGT